MWSGRFLSLLVIVMMGIILYEVVLRYFFNRPTTWALELTTMIFGVYMMGGGIYALLVDGHVRMDLFYDKWPVRRKAFADVLTFPLFMFFFCILLWKATAYGIDSLVMMEHSKTTWSPPIYPWKLSIPIIVLLMLAQGLSNFMKNLHLLITGKTL